MKFKIGEVVKIRDDIAGIAIDGVYNLYSGVLDLAGKEVTIAGAYEGTYGPRYLIEGYGRTFLEEFFEPKKEEPYPEVQTKGMARNLDSLGRITIPIEYRRSIGIETLEALDLYIVNKVIRLKKGKGRKLDALGRYTIPIEVRRSLRFDRFELVDVFVEGNEICIKKVMLQCVRCGSTEKQLIESGGVLICSDCIHDLFAEVAWDNK